MVFDFFLNPASLQYHGLSFIPQTLQNGVVTSVDSSPATRAGLGTRGGGDGSPTPGNT
jgi:hypothetical protein